MILSKFSLKLAEQRKSISSADSSDDEFINETEEEKRNVDSFVFFFYPWNSC